MREALLDTGVLVALADRRDAYHEACLRFVADYPGRLRVPPTVVTETAWMLEKYLGPEAEAAFLSSVGSGEIEPVGLEHSDLKRMAELVRKYADFPLGAVDASVVAIAERLGLREIATIDRRHFSAVRPEHVTSFALFP